jgi:hypothetical protein
MNERKTTYFFHGFTPVLTSAKSRQNGILQIKLIMALLIGKMTLLQDRLCMKQTQFK